MWINLLRYRVRSDGAVSSYADTDNFFLSKKGKTDSRAELRATLEAFFVKEKKQAQHPQCRFPARYRWLKKRLDFDTNQLVERECPRFEKWKSELDTHSVSLIFASAFLNNPASMYGHTFLRLNRKKRSSGSDLVAYTVSYAATRTTSNALFTAVLGLFGGFPGSFSTLPYYMKVSEYRDMENRDIWEYDLTLSSEEIARMVAHIWEVGPVGFDYFYLDENCSLHILALLDVARPSLRLMQDFATWVTPVDTIRSVLRREKLVVETSFRPSRVQRMRAYAKVLSSEEQELAQAIGNREDEKVFERLQPYSASRKALILDAAYEVFRYKNGEQLNDEQKFWERKLLLARGRTKVPSQPIQVTKPSPPQSGHPTTTLSLGFGQASTGEFMDILFRPALHDLLSDNRGYVRDSEINFVQMNFRIPLDKTGLFLERLDLFRVVSIAPVESIQNRISWKLNIGAKRIYEAPCVESGCLEYTVEGGPGLAYRFEGSTSLTLYSFLDFGFGFSDAHRYVFEFDAGSSAGLLWEPLPGWRWQAEAQYIYPIDFERWPTVKPRQLDGAHYRLYGAQALNLGDGFEFRTTYSRSHVHEEIFAALRHYF
ncbi:MAG: DUF4105 domain-containing protein [Myxococcota bacterium]|nr:DUF4105 domain-containing protein [Myxococcota bacterium]